MTKAWWSVLLLSQLLFRLVLSWYPLWVGTCLFKCPAVKYYGNIQSYHYCQQFLVQTQYTSILVSSVSRLLWATHWSQMSNFLALVTWVLYLHCVGLWSILPQGKQLGLAVILCLPFVQLMPCGSLSCSGFLNGRLQCSHRHLRSFKPQTNWSCSVTMLSEITFLLATIKLQ